MGTPEFAVSSLQILLEHDINIVGVVTAPDKPAGRGQKLWQSPVKQFALEHNLPVLQPVKLKDPSFIADYQALAPDLNVVVAFRMLPEAIWAFPGKGTFNLHASLLPQYRGAAPINHAIINGETETGVTTFFIDQEIDTGRIIFQEKVPISDTDNAGSLHDRLMKTGAELVLKTVQQIEKEDVSLINQQEIIDNQNLVLHPAPKIFKEDTRINWEKTAREIHHFIRGLSPVPGSFTTLINTDNKEVTLKIYRSSLEINPTFAHTGAPVLVSDDKHLLYVSFPGARLHLEELQAEGRKRLPKEDFLRGFPVMKQHWKLLIR